MKKILAVLAVAIIALVAAGVSMAAISGSKHDLTFSNNTYYTTETTEICVFCHTPHQANTLGSVVPAPLWNKTYIPTQAANFVAYGPTSWGSATMTALNTSTKACLSCHDGTQAMNALANAPGSGNNAISNTNLGPISNTSTALIDQNFKNDHPIGVIYDSGNDLRTPSGTSAPGNVVRILSANSIDADDTDDTVECASCHQVHGDSGAALFLPIANTGSAVCLACHMK